MAPLLGNRITAPDAPFEMAEWQDPGGVTSVARPIAPPHIHREDDEAWYVLEGRLGFRIADRTFEAGPGEAAWAKRGEVHSFWNASPARARYLLVTTPKIFALVDALHQPSATDYKALFREYDSELL